jgi:uncharacterized membrane protein YqhA
MDKHKIYKNTNGDKLGSLLGRSKWIAFLAVMVLYASSGIVVFVGLVKLFYIVKDMSIKIGHSEEIDTILLSANFMIIIEIYLLAIIFYIFAIGIYKLFVGEFRSLVWYRIESLDEMKAELAKAIVIFLAVFLVQKIVEWKDGEHLLHVGIVVSLISGILIWYAKLFKNNKPNNHTINKE